MPPGGQAIPRPPMPGQPMGMPPAPTPQPMSPQPMPPQPMAPQPMAPAPAPVPAAAPAPAFLSLGVPAGETIHMVTSGDILNNDHPVFVVVTDSHIIIVPENGAPRLERQEGVRHAVVGDWDGDGTFELALFSDSEVWVLRTGETGSVSSRKVSVPNVPKHLSVAPFVRDGQSVLMSVSEERVTFYKLHPARGLVEAGSTLVPPIA